MLHTAQKIVSRQKHNMLSLFHAACLKLLVFFKGHVAGKFTSQIKTNFVFSYYFSKWSALLDNVEKFLEPVRTQMEILCISVACRIPKTTKHSQNIQYY